MIFLNQKMRNGKSNAKCMHAKYCSFSVSKMDDAFSLQVTLGSVSPTVANGFSPFDSNSPVADGTRAAFSPKVFDVHCWFFSITVDCLRFFLSLEDESGEESKDTAHPTRYAEIKEISYNCQTLSLTSTEHHAQRDEVGEEDEAEAEAEEADKDKAEAVDGEEGNVSDKAVTGK